MLRAALGLMLLSLLACSSGRIYSVPGESIELIDSGAAVDSGAASDSSAAVDSGTTPDGGFQSDTPLIEPDAGAPDAAAPIDSGPSMPDAGPAPAHCADGPLMTPIVGCAPLPSAPTGDHAFDCVRRINQFRLECQCLPPLERWVDGEACAAEHAEYDSEGRAAHSGFRDRICAPSGSAQNECPGYRGEGSIVSTCLQQMWDEGPGPRSEGHGHYLTMSSSSLSRVACGLLVRPDGRVWAVQNFQ